MRWPVCQTQSSVDSITSWVAQQLSRKESPTQGEVAAVGATGNTSIGATLDDTLRKTLCPQRISLTLCSSATSHRGVTCGPHSNDSASIGSKLGMGRT